MCLDTVDSEIKVARKTGYKLVHHYSYEKPMRSVCEGFKFPLNEWVTDDNDGNILTEGGVRYPKGFHVYGSLKGAKRSHLRSHEIRKCLIDEVVASGKEGRAVVIVARKIKIGEVVK